MNTTHTATIQPCPACLGTMRTIGQPCGILRPCPTCNGTGTAPKPPVIRPYAPNDDTRASFDLLTAALAGLAARNVPLNSHLIAA